MIVWRTLCLAGERKCAEECKFVESIRIINAKDYQILWLIDCPLVLLSLPPSISLSLSLYRARAAKWLHCAGRVSMEMQIRGINIRRNKYRRKEKKDIADPRGDTSSPPPPLPPPILLPICLSFVQTIGNGLHTCVRMAQRRKSDKSTEIMYAPKKAASRSGRARGHATLVLFDTCQPLRRYFLTGETRHAAQSTRLTSA